MRERRDAFFFYCVLYPVKEEQLKIISEFEKARTNQEMERKLKKEDILYSSYLRCRDANSDILNLAWPVREEHVDHIIGCCLKHGIREITLSFIWKGLFETIGQFEKRGCKIMGIGVAKDIVDERMPGEYEKVPAILLSICKKKCVNA